MLHLERQRAALSAKLSVERRRTEQILAEKAALEERLAALVMPSVLAASDADSVDADATAEEDAGLEQGDAASAEACAAGFVAQHGAKPDTRPTAEEVREYALYLGMDPVVDAELLYVAEWALTAPPPAGWSVHANAQGAEFFFCEATGVSSYEHPLDAQYRSYAVACRRSVRAAAAAR
jgi:hypothetical protein